MIDEYKGMLSSEVIPPKVLGMLDDSIMDKRYMMPLSYDETSHLLTIVTSQFEQNFLDSQVILQIVRKKFSEVTSVKFLSCEYNNFYAGYVAHYKKNFIPTLSGQQVTVKSEAKVTTEQTKKSEDIISRAITLGASDIHITPNRNGASVIYRIDGKLRDSGFTLSREDELMICRIYKTNAKSTSIT